MTSIKENWLNGPISKFFCYNQVQGVVVTIYTQIHMGSPSYDLLRTDDKNVSAYTTNFLDYSIPLGYNTVSIDEQFLMFPRDVVPLSSRI